MELFDDNFRLLTVASSGEIKTIEGEGGEQLFLPTGTGISILGIYESAFELYLFRPVEGIVTWSITLSQSIEHLEADLQVEIVVA